MPGVSLVNTVIANLFSWETIPELGSDHLLSLLIWGDDIKVEHDHTRRRTNYPKADLLLFRKCLDNGIHAVKSDGSLSKHLEALCNLLKRTEAEVFSVKAVHKREIPWMNAQPKKLIQKCNKLPRDPRTNRCGWR